MKYDFLTEGLEVYYQNLRGTVAFTCSQYVTVCVRKFDDRSKNVNLLVYREQWKNILLTKESEK